MKGKALQYQCDFKRWAGWVQTGMVGTWCRPVAGSGDAALSWYQCATPSPQCPQNALMISVCPSKSTVSPARPSCCLPCRSLPSGFADPDQDFQQWLVSPEIKWCIILAPLEPLCIHSANWKGRFGKHILWNASVLPLSATWGGLLSQPGCIVFLVNKFTSWLFQNMPNYLLKFLNKSLLKIKCFSS